MLQNAALDKEAIRTHGSFMNTLIPPIPNASQDTKSLMLLQNSRFVRFEQSSNALSSITLTALGIAMHSSDVY